MLLAALQGGGHSAPRRRVISRPWGRFARGLAARSALLSFCVYPGRAGACAPDAGTALLVSEAVEHVVDKRIKARV